MMAKARWQPSLKTAVAAIILLVLLPTLIVAAIALWNAGSSYRDASTRQLLATAQVVSRSVQNELDLNAQWLFRMGEIEGSAGRSAEAQTENNSHPLGNDQNGKVYHFRLRHGQFVGGNKPQDAPNEVIRLAQDVGKGEDRGLSNIFSIRTNTGVEPQVAMAVSHVDVGTGTVMVLVRTTTPTKAIRALNSLQAGADKAILAITDGTGRIIARSAEPERYVGKPVPDWDHLIALGTNTGSFRAVTIEGREVVFAFHKIPDTPGWAAVVGERAASFDNRWQTPMLVMLLASGLTVIVALLLGVLVVRRILHPITLLAERARLVATSDPAQLDTIHVDVPRSRVEEFETLRVSLDAAETVLRESLAESRKAEWTARRSAEALQQAERLARIGSWTLALPSMEFTVSDMLYEMNGADPKGPPITVDGLGQMLSPESFTRLNQAIQKCIETGQSYALEVEHLHPDGHYFIAYIQGKAVFDPDGQMVALTGTVQDIHDQVEQRQRLAALTDNLPSGFIFRLERDPNMDFSLDAIKVTYASAGVERLIGVSVADTTRDPRVLAHRVMPRDRMDLWAALKRSNATGEVFDHQFRVKTRQGRLLWMHVRAAIRKSSEGRVVWDGIARDMTVEHEAAEVLRSAKNAAEMAEQVKTDFLATMSHEIRTPMNTVICKTRLALQTGLDAKQRNYLEKIDRSASTLLGIINDILDFTKIEADGLLLEHTSFTLESVLDTVSTVTALKADEKGLELTFAIDPKIPSVLKGDPLRLGQVLTNLIGNAIKFTLSGDILLSIRPVPERHRQADQESVMLEFSVRDTGIGLTQDQISGLFKPFTQASTDTSRKYGGTGLGLAICKRLVEMMGGEIWVQSTPGAGSTFIFTAKMDVLPAEEGELKAKSRTTFMPDRRVLICDDNESARHVLTDMVSRYGIDTHTVGSGAQALEALHQAANQGNPFHMVLLDWRMPEMDGLETARRIKADARLVEMPAVLMVTAYGNEMVAKSVEQIGLQGLLLKPVTQSMLFNTLHSVLSEFAGQSSRLSLGTGLQAQSLYARFKGLAGKHVLVVDDNSLNREVASDFLDLVGVRVGQAVTGRDALLKITEAQVAGRQYDAVLMDMHMPEMNGLEAVRAIRANPEWQDLPVIALTAQARQEDYQASLDAGMSAHLTKPLNEISLFQTLYDVMGLEHKTDDLGAVSPDEDSAQSLYPVQDVLHSMITSPPRRERLIGGFLRDFHAAPEQFDTHMQVQDWSVVAELVHQIKGCAGYLGADDLGHVAEVVERAARQGDVDTVVRNSHRFRALLVSCLEALAIQLEEFRGQMATHSLADSVGAGDDVMRLFDQVEPLVEQGDFAAQSLLDRILSMLVVPEHQAALRAIQDCFDDLELDEAAARLMRLRQELSAEEV